MKTFILLIPLCLFSIGIFGQNFQELPDSLDINASRFPIEKVFIENIDNNRKTNLKKGNYKINRVIGSTTQNDIFSINENGFIDGKSIHIRGYKKRISEIKESQIVQTEVYDGEHLVNKQIFEPFKDSILVSQILNKNHNIRSKVSRYFTKKDSLKTLTTNYDENGKRVEFIDEIKKIRIDYDDNGKIKKYKKNIDGQIVEKTYEDGNLKLFTKGSYPYFYIEQYDSNGNIELKKILDGKNNEITTSYKNGKLIAKKFSENDKDVEEYYENGKLIEKHISFIKDFKYYVEIYKNGKLTERNVSKVEEKKAY